jgi:hypothetical protein
MREVERQTVYEPPLELQGSAGDSLEVFPVNLLYTYSHSSDVTILARVQFTGLDFSNRSGNYFAHSLVTSSPDDDLSTVLPVELWDAPFWQSRQGSSAELPPLTSPPPAGSISRLLIAGFPATQGVSSGQVAALLSAADVAMNAGRQLLLIGPDAETVCRWIATVSYLLGPVLARRLTFSTYSYDPRRCRTHVVGIVTETKRQRPGITANFHVFEPGENVVVPEIQISPSALLLARLGVASAAEVWALAHSLARPVVAGSAGPEAYASLTDAFPVLASAALMLGHQLTAAEVSGAVTWLHSEGATISRERIAAALAGAVEQPLAQLSADQKERLVEVAARADESAAVPDGHLLKRIERGLVDSAFREQARGQPAGAGIALRTSEAKRAASDGCTKRLPGCGAMAATDLLAWASAVGAEPASHVVHGVGRDVMLDSLRTKQAPPGLAEMAAGWPVLRAGMVARLASMPPARQAEVLASPEARLFRRQDFAEHTALGVEWLVGQADSGSMSRTLALARIAELGRADGADPAIDQDLVERLWHGHSWTIAEGVELVDRLPAVEVGTVAVASRLAALLRELPGYRNFDPWAALVRRLAGLPAGTLPAETAALAAEFSPLITLIRSAEQQHPPDAEIDELLSCYQAGSHYARILLHNLMPRLLLRHRRLGSVLADCPPELFGSFCRYAQAAITAHTLTVRTIAKLVVAMQTLERWHPRYAEDLDLQVLRPILAYCTPSEIGTLEAEAELIERNSSQRLEFWYRRIRRKRSSVARLWRRGR